MSMPRDTSLALVRVFLLALCIAGGDGALRLAAQTPASATPADSAGVIYQTAMRLEAEGQVNVAASLLRHLVRQYPGTPAAAQAERWLARPRLAVPGSGRGELMVWYTIYGAWLGLAVPAALGAEEPEQVGVGLLLGAPIGFLMSRSYARATKITQGQARLLDFGSQWGTWQGLGWQAALDLGSKTETVCQDPSGTPPCFESTTVSPEAPWTAMVVGGLTGAVGSALITGGRNIHTGGATRAIHMGLWGTWFGFAGAVLANVEDGDVALAWSLVGGDLGVITGAVWKHPDISSGRVWLITAGGFGGLISGIGVDALIQPEDDQLAILIPAMGSALGLFLASQWTRSYDAERRASARDGASLDEMASGSLLTIQNGHLAVAIPAVMPTLSRRDNARGRRALGLYVPLLQLGIGN